MPMTYADDLIVRRNKQRIFNNSVILGTYVALGVLMVLSFFITVSTPALLRKAISQDMVDSEVRWGDFKHSYDDHTRAQGDHTIAQDDQSEWKTFTRFLNQFIEVARIEGGGEIKASRDAKPGKRLVAGSSPAPLATIVKLKVLIGILMHAWQRERRDILRLAYGLQASDSDDAEFTVRFVLGAVNSSTEWEQTLVATEKALYGDIIVLKCPENINAGQTFEYFSSLPAMGDKYDYVMKTGDDSYVRLDNLGKRLKPLPRMDLYYGYNPPCENDDPYAEYILGAGYLISWDLVLWIRNSPIPQQDSIGIEDRLVGQWFDRGGKAKNRATDKALLYDHVDSANQYCRHRLIEETILVHAVKTPAHWAQVLVLFELGRIVRVFPSEQSSGGYFPRVPISNSSLPHEILDGP